MATRSVHPWSTPWPADRARAPGAIEQVLIAARNYLAVEAAFVSPATRGKVVIQYAQRGSARLIEVGSEPMDANRLCRRILEGRLLPAVAAAPAPALMVPSVAYFSVPLTLSDGSLQGTFCCLSPHRDSARVEQDRNVLAAYARLAAAQIEDELASAERHRHSALAGR